MKIIEYCIGYLMAWSVTLKKKKKLKKIKKSTQFVAMAMMH